MRPKGDYIMMSLDGISRFISGKEIIMTEQTITGMSAFTQARKSVVARILKGDGRASHTLRRAAFANAGLAEPLRTLIDKIAKHAYKVTDEDIAAARASGFIEDQIFEIVVCAAIGQATRQYDSALAALDAATERSEHAPRDPR
jgi:hypothetical protein